MQRHDRRDRRFGFTILELMIVVAIVAIVIAVAVPSLQNAKRSARESKGIASCKVVAAAMESYRGRYGRYGNATGLQESGYLEQWDRLSSVFLTTESHKILVAPSSSRGWVCYVIAASGADGEASYYMDASGVIRYNTSGGLASVSSPPLGEEPD